MKKTILITGGCGFVGSNLAIQLKIHNPGYHIICFDNLKRRGSELNIERLKNTQIEFIHGDIRNKPDLDQVTHTDVIIDAAAEPSVLAGINSSTDYVVQTNLMGTINTLDLAKKHQADVIFLSTSRVYPITNIEKIEFTETDT
ncbi:MAG: NAD-dependent epimerase/dehydratase family protein, partial [Bacteroidales bacterium]|nr:NAD-dependent epimerase/dehydratase family protein [Bacteroidales bacterium]